MFGLFLLSTNTVLVNAQAQSDDFPIGMYIEYIVYNEISSSPGSTYSIRYDFMRWIDQEDLIVEYEKDSVEYSESLTEICLDGPIRPSLWMDISAWQVGDDIEISGRLYALISISSYSITPSDYFEIFRLEYSNSVSSIHQFSSLHYHRQLGILVTYYYHAYDSEDSSLVEHYDGSILTSNFTQYNPPTFTVPEPTQSTTTTTSTTPSTSTSTSTTTSTTQTTRSSTTSTITLLGIPQSPLTVIMEIGIFIEVFIIIKIVRSRDKYA